MSGTSRRTSNVDKMPGGNPLRLLEAARDYVRSVNDGQFEFDGPLERAREAFVSERIVFCSPDERGALVVRGSSAAPEQRRERASPVSALTARVFRSGSAARANPAGPNAPGGARGPEMAAPVVAHGSVSGVLSVSRSPGQPAFTEGESAALATFADFLGLVIKDERQRGTSRQESAASERRESVDAQLAPLIGTLLNATIGMSELASSLAPPQQVQIARYLSVVDETLAGFRSILAEEALTEVQTEPHEQDGSSSSEEGGALLRFTGPYAPAGQWNWEEGNAAEEMNNQITAILSDIYLVTTQLAAAERLAPPSGREIIATSVDQLDDLTLRIRAAAARFEQSQTVVERLAKRHSELTSTESLHSDQIAMIGHDVRGPLAVVLMYLELLADQDLSEDDAWILSRARRAALRTRQLLERILTLAVTDSGDLGSEPERIQLERWLPDFLHTVQRGDEVTITENSYSGQVLFDESQLAQILTNLVNNAFRHGSPPVTVRARASASMVTIDVADDGAGVSAEALQHLFDRDVLTTRPAADGVLDPGLGLYLSRRLARANGADLTYQPPSHGSQGHFTLAIPVKHDGPSRTDG